VRFLLSGYYGFGNLGDEMLLEVIVGKLRERYPAAIVDVLSEKPEETKRTLGVEATARMDLSAVRASIEAADIVLSGGGGLFQNATSLKSLIYYAGIVRTAIHAGRRAMIFAQSIGPLDFIGRQTVRECCKGLHAATVRDERSRAVLADLVSGVTIERTADPVFLIDPPPQSPDIAAELGVDGDPLVVVCVRKTTAFAEGIERLAAAVDAFAALGARVVFLPIGGAADAEASVAIIRRCNSTPMLLPVTSSAQAMRVIARARLVIGVRLHALILAIRFGVPFLAVPYDPKVVALCEDIGYPLPPLWTPGTRVGEGDPAEAARAAWARKEELAMLVGEAAKKMRVEAERNFTVLDRLVQTVGK
jgi:polysaccharide pyruvyl transferase CsaB